MKYQIPQKVLKEFLALGAKNFSKEDHGHIETLAYLVGHNFGRQIIITDMIFPDQDGFPGHVDDKGKPNFHQILPFRIPISVVEINCNQFRSNFASVQCFKHS